MPGLRQRAMGLLLPLGTTITTTTNKQQQQTPLSMEVHDVYGRLLIPCLINRHCFGNYWISPTQEREDGESTTDATSQ